MLKLVDLVCFLYNSEQRFAYFEHMCTIWVDVVLSNAFIATRGVPRTISNGYDGAFLQK